MKIALLVSFVLVAVLGVPAQGNVACPKITVEGPAGVTNPGETMTFNATAEGVLILDSKFEWTVSAGTIESGQGTSSITVRVPPDGSVDKVLATVKVAGPLVGCTDTFTAEALAQPRQFVCGLAPDDYPKLSQNDQRARIYNAAHMLSMNPNNVLVFVLYLSPSESAASGNRRAAFIRDFLLKDKLVASGSLRIPSDRLSLVFASGAETHTAVYLIPFEKLDSFVQSFEASRNIEDVRPIK